MWGFPLISLSHNCSLAWPRVEQVACCGRVGQEAKLESRYFQLLTNTYVVRFRLERYTLMFRELTISSDVCLAVFLLGCEAFPTGERLSPSWLKYTFFVFRSHWFACSVTFLSVGQFGFGVVGDAGFYVLLYVDRLHLLVPVLGTHLCGGSPWRLYLTTCSLALPRVEQVACCGRVGEEVKLGSRYFQLLTNT